MKIVSDGITPADQFGKFQNPTDIPSMDNKAYEHPLGVDGGVSPYQGIFANQTEEAAKVNLVDKVTARVDMKSIVAIGIGAVVLYLIVRYSK